MVTPVTPCHPTCGAENKGTPTPATPQSSNSKRDISPSRTCQSQGIGPDLERSTTTSTLADPRSSVLAMIIPAKTCHQQGGAGLKHDRNGPPTPVAPQVYDSERYISPANTGQSQGGDVIERDSTTAPTPGTPLSSRESPAVTGRDTLSCSSPPNSFTDKSLSKECTVLRGQSQSVIFHRADRQTHVMCRRVPTTE